MKTILGLLPLALLAQAGPFETGTPCGQIFNLDSHDDSVEIYSPNWPGFYSNHGRCSWVLNNGLAANGYQIQLHFNAFNTEHGYDYLSVIYGSNNVRYSGVNNGLTLNISAAAVQLLFTTDGSVTRPGFDITASLFNPSLRESCNNQGNLSCACLPGYEGPRCSQVIDWCAKNATADGAETIGEICSAHGTCISNPAEGPECICNYGFNGSLCQTPIHGVVIESERCALWNNSIVANESVVLECPDGQRCIPDDINCPFDRPHCPNPIGWCVPKGDGDRFIAEKTKAIEVAKARALLHAIQPNQLFDVGAICDWHGDGVCTCDQGYTGERCEIEIDYCALNNPCGPHGNCSSDPINGASCTCAHGWSGNNCDQPVPGEVTESVRCLLWAVDASSVAVGCPLPGQRCLTDDLNCPFDHCSNPIGWCLPEASVISILESYSLRKANPNIVA